LRAVRLRKGRRPQEADEARRQAACEESFRRAQQGNDWVRYLAALRALQEVEELAAVVLRMETR
jgi:hypothetical protein